MSMVAFWIVMPRGLVCGCKRFGGTYRPSSLTLKTEEVCSSEMLVHTYKSTLRHNSEDQHQHSGLDPSSLGLGSVTSAGYVPEYVFHCPATQSMQLRAHVCASPSCRRPQARQTNKPRGTGLHDPNN